MSETIAITNYFKRLKRIIDTEALFTLFNYRLIRKTRIDDIMCCIYATLPEEYSKLLKTKSSLKSYKSIVAFGMLSKLFTHNFKLDKNLILIDYQKTQKTLNTIIVNIEKDIENIERDITNQS